MDQLKGIDIFLFKAYIEKTERGSVGTAFWANVTEVFVNVQFYLLNIIVYFNSEVLKKMETFSLYEVYKKTIYDTSKEIWQALIGHTEENAGVQGGSVFWVLLSLFVLYLAYLWVANRGNISQKVIHLLVVISLAFSYFGTIQGTDGGLYLLNGVRSLSQEAFKVVNGLSLTISGQSVDKTMDFSEEYISSTSYQSYLYVNTGRIDGKFFNKETEKDEEFDHKKVLGEVVDGSFHPVSSEERLEYIEKLGDGALDNKEKNRWVSAVSDFFFLKVFYVAASIYKALILPIPYMVIHLFRILAEMVVLIIMVGFPFLLIASFIPFLQNYLIGTIKLFFIASVFPSVGSIMLLVVSVVNAFIASGFSDLFGLEGATELLMSNITYSAVSILVYMGFWYGKGFIFSILSGGNAAAYNGIPSVLDKSVNHVNVDNVHDLVKHSLDFFQDRGNDVPVEDSYDDVVSVEDAEVEEEIPEVDEKTISPDETSTDEMDDTLEESDDSLSDVDEGISPDEISEEANSFVPDSDDDEMQAMDDGVFVEDDSSLNSSEIENLEIDSPIIDRQDPVTDVIIEEAGPIEEEEVE